MRNHVIGRLARAFRHVRQSTRVTISGVSRSRDIQISIYGHMSNWLIHSLTSLHLSHLLTPSLTSSLTQTLTHAGTGTGNLTAIITVAFKNMKDV